MIFLHGDGMGIAHRELVRLATKGRDGQLAMDSLRYAGWSQTDPADAKEAVTDSAAGATAFASGVRTSNGAVGVDVNGNPVPTLLERARAAGKATGLVTTAQVTDASPAAFGAQLLGVFANEMFEQRVEGGGDLYEPVVSLRDMTLKALDVLSRDRQGFFLFVEEEAIDEMAHRNNARLTIESGRALDAAVEVAVRFAATHPGTLIVVAGDHETGGLATENVNDADETATRSRRRTARSRSRPPTCS